MNGISNIDYIVSEVGELGSIAHFGEIRLIELAHKIQLLYVQILDLSAKNHVDILESKIAEFKALLQTTRKSLNNWKNKLSAYLTMVQEFIKMFIVQTPSPFIDYFELSQKITSLLIVIDEQLQFIGVQEEKLDQYLALIKQKRKKLISGFERARMPVFVDDDEDCAYEY